MGMKLYIGENVVKVHFCKIIEDVAACHSFTHMHLCWASSAALPTTSRSTRLPHTSETSQKAKATLLPRTNLFVLLNQFFLQDFA